MNGQPTTHPAAEQLSAFGLGKLNDAAAAAIAQHLESCLPCRKAVERVAGDTFVGLVRAAKAPAVAASLSQTPLPNERKLTVTQTPAAPPPGLPPELAQHAKYRIARELGRGGMGVVYQAKHIDMDRDVAIKVINKSILEHPQALQRFAQEVRAAAKLSHPNIVAAYDFEKAGDLHMLVMEFVEGQNLAEIVERKGPLPIVHACHYVRQAALGLQHAHEKGMVHRDLKPQNMMLAPKGIVKLLDMGLARVASDKEGLTGTGATLGTPEYIAPEQAMDAAKADIRSDIYSLGCTLYCLLAGKPPFADGTAMQKILGHLEREPQPLPQLRPEVPEKLAAVVARMMAKDPAQRYQKPVEVAQALAPFCKAGAKGVAVEPTPVAEPAAVVAARPASPTMPTSSSAVRRDTLTAGGAKGSLLSAKKKTQKVLSRPTGLVGNKWLIGGAAAGVTLLTFIVLIGLVGLWAGGVFKAKMKDGTIVLENLPADADVTVDGETVTVTPADGKTFTVRVDASKKKHRVEVKKDGFKVFGDEVEVDAGGRKSVLVTLEPKEKPADGASTKVPVEKELPKTMNVVKVTALRVIEGHEDSVNYLLFTSNGVDLISACNGNNAASGWAAGGKDKTVRVWTVKTGLQKYQFIAKDEKDRFGYTPQGLAVSPDGRFVAACTSWNWARSYRHSRVFVWDMLTGKQKHLLVLPENNAARSIGFSKDGKTVYIARSGSSVNSFSLPDGAESPTINLEDQDPIETPLGTTFTPGCRYVLGGVRNQKGPFSLWDRESGKVMKTFFGHTQVPWGFTMSRDGTQILSCAGDRSVRLWDTESRRELFRLDKLDSNVLCVAFSPDGKRFLTGAEDGTMALRDTTTGDEIARLLGHTGKVNTVVFSTDGQLAASGSDDKTVRLWQLPVSPPTAPDPVSSDDPDRKAAAYVLSIGGTVRVNDEARDIKAAADLPREMFRLTYVDMHANNRVSDEGLAYFKDCKNLTYLSCEGTPLSDLSLLKDMKLTYLNCNGTQVSDLTPLKGMPLARLECGATQVSDLSPLKDMKLTYLRCHQTQVFDLSPLKDMKLTHLECRGTRVSDLSPLKDMKLTTLYCYDTPVTDAGLMPLQEMPSLRVLEIGGPKMSEAGLAHLNKLIGLEHLAFIDTKLTGAGLVHLKGMTGLQVLNLGNTELTDEGLVHLKGLLGLRELILVKTRVTDSGLEHLAGLKNLGGLKLNGTAVTDKGVAKLKAALPKCNITR